VALLALLRETTTVTVALAPEARAAAVPCTPCPLEPPVTSPLPLTLSTFRPVGTTSVTVTSTAVLGPALLTTIAKLMVAPAPVPLGVLAVFTTLRSALAVTPMVAVRVLFRQVRVRRGGRDRAGAAGHARGTVKVSVCDTEVPTASVSVV